MNKKSALLTTLLLFSIILAYGVRSVHTVLDDSNPPDEKKPPPPSSQLTLISPTNTTYLGTLLALTFSGNDLQIGPDAWTYSIDGQTNVSINSNVAIQVVGITVTVNATIDGISQGSHSVVVYSLDMTGQTLVSDTVFFTFDSTPPTIANVTQNPPSNPVPVGDQVTVNATVVDNISGIKQATIDYTIVNGTGTWRQAVSMMNAEGDLWRGVIPGFQDGTYITYRILAQDNAGNTARTTTYGYQCGSQTAPEFSSASATAFLITITTVLATLLRIRRSKRRTPMGI